MPHKLPFSRDDYFKMLDDKLSNIIQETPGFGAPPGLTEAFQATIRRRKQFGARLPRLAPEDFSKS